ncbi:hypothetical protein GUITHDRAFT_70296 [Guillardia theta CCMP2712]|uniref:FAD-binding domain-containing protein n=2 Tax=Guillardia theta TaxID=55529 RepID=L1JE75_GUITC|nr:hypothetical protein GUITHDRAFT_70296 [Guillardia theta CCMP2712]EKX46622.1 hypothetical protein GUITHDRAFT_70296 [Guillardia theta CCMP2712]|eukprot:XP_005833602.1 hypothetical protein GUITHDRAFT_70296 [Guillardia theta CCMP2712]
MFSSSVPGSPAPLIRSSLTPRSWTRSWSAPSVAPSRALRAPLRSWACSATAPAAEGKQDGASGNEGQTAIIGAGPTGLATAIMLAQRGWKDIHVYDRLSPPPNPDDDNVWSDTAKFYLIGIGGRGQRALKNFGIWDDVDKYCTTVVGRMDWAPGAGEDEGIERIFTDRPYLTKVIARDRLVGVLERIVKDKFGGQVHLHYGNELRTVEWKDKQGKGGCEFEIEEFDVESLSTVRPPTSTVTITSGEKETKGTGRMKKLNAKLLIGADGAARTLANVMQEESEKSERGMFKRPFRVIRYPDDNQRIYKTIPLKLPKGWRSDLNYSARTQDGRINIDALPASPNGDYCAVLLLKANDPLAAANTDPKELRALLDKNLPQFSKLIDEESLKAIAAKPPSRLPSFRYVEPYLHRGDSTVLLGDAIHTVKPYFGLGVNSAFEDVQKLSECLDKHESSAGMEGALSQFSSIRAGEAKALVQISRGFDRPGLKGFFSFILPIILDGIFNKLAPQVFGQNTISMLQQEGMTFQGVRDRKRRDRVLQVLVLGTIFFTIFKVVSAVVQALPKVVLFGITFTFLGVLGGLQLNKVLKPGMSTADVIASTEKKYLSKNKQPSSGTVNPTSDGAAKTS